MTASREKLACVSRRLFVCSVAPCFAQGWGGSSKQSETGRDSAPGLGAGVLEGMWDSAVGVWRVASPALGI